MKQFMEKFMEGCCKGDEKFDPEKMRELLKSHGCSCACAEEGAKAAKGEEPKQEADKSKTGCA